MFSSNPSVGAAFEATAGAAAPCAAPHLGQNAAPDTSAPHAPQNAMNIPPMDSSDAESNKGSSRLQSLSYPRDAGAALLAHGHLGLADISVCHLARLGDCAFRLAGRAARAQREVHREERSPGQRFVKIRGVAIQPLRHAARQDTEGQRILSERVWLQRKTAVAAVAQL